MTGLSTICNFTKSVLAVHVVFLQMEFAVGCVVKSRLQRAACFNSDGLESDV